jgi:hypothetical protein
MLNGTMPPGVVSLYGPAGTLKSSIAITWPKKVKVYDFDLGSHRAWDIEKAKDEGDVVVERMIVPEKSITTRRWKIEGASELWAEFLQSYLATLANDEFNTVVIDTNTVNWNLIQDSYLQEVQKKTPSRVRLQRIEFGEPNARMRALFNVAKARQKHLIMVMHETDEYIQVVVNGKPMLDEDNRPVSAPSGEKAPDGFKATRNMSDWVLVSSAPIIDTDGGKQVVPQVIIEKSPMGIDLVGLPIKWFTYDKLVTYLKGLGRI